MKLIVFVGVLLACAHGAEWRYSGEHGPEHWADSYDTCGTNSQSPINIVTSAVQYDSTLGEFDLSTYYKVSPNAHSFTVTNNGHSLQVNIPGTQDDVYNVSQGGLPHTYMAAQFHFHWGKTNTVGSEHTVDGEPYPMEMHIVHYSEEYGIDNSALDKDEGLAVLGFFFDIGAHNAAFDVIVNTLQNISVKGDTQDIPAFPLADLLPTNLRAFYRYAGGLTTPPCYESVVWTVFQSPIIISQPQMDAFKTMYFTETANETEVLENNYRPVQNLNGRVVRSSIPLDDGNDPSSSQMLSFSVLLLALPFISSLIL